MGGVLTGAGTRVNLQWEQSYGTAESSPSPFVPGASATLDTAEATNNGTRITLPASKITVQIEEGTFDGAWAISGLLSDPWIFRSIYGSPSTTDNGDGTYTHTYSLGEPDSFQILEGYETSQTDERTLKGCVTARFAVDPTVDQGEGAPFVMEGFYAGADDLDTSATLTGQDQFDENPLDYGDATLKVGGSAESIVQDASLELAWDPIEPIDAFGSRFAVDFVAGLFTPTVDYSKIKQDSDSLQDVYGGSTSMQEDIENTKSFQLDFDNGKAAGSGKSRILFDAGVTFPEGYDEDGVGEPRSPITENLNRMIENVDVKATNETSSPP